MLRRRRKQAARIETGRERNTDAPRGSKTRVNATQTRRAQKKAPPDAPQTCFTNGKRHFVGRSNALSSSNRPKSSQGRVFDRRAVRTSPTGVIVAAEQRLGRPTHLLPSWQESAPRRGELPRRKPRLRGATVRRNLHSHDPSPGEGALTQSAPARTPRSRRASRPRRCPG